MSKHRRNKEVRRPQEHNNWDAQTKSLYDLITKEIQEATTPFLGTPNTRWNQERMISGVERAISPYLSDIHYDSNIISGVLEISGIIRESISNQAVSINIRIG